MVDLALRGRNSRDPRISRRVWVRFALVAMLLCPLMGGVGQVAPASQPGSTRPPLGPDVLGPPDPMGGPNPRRLEHMREDDRHKRLLSDTTKLLELTTELKNEVDKSSKDELSLDVVRKAAEIEKLAHDVKERMKN